VGIQRICCHIDINVRHNHLRSRILAAFIVARVGADAEVSHIITLCGIGLFRQGHHRWRGKAGICGLL
jgi:hypothetical protein